MRFAYADPPYLGQGAKRYGYPEWDEPERHFRLIDVLVEEFPEGWALSLSSPSLRVLLPYCPDDVRVMAWVKPFSIYKMNVNPSYSWEPVIVRGGRKRGRDFPTTRDFVEANVTLQRGLPGAKPAAFCDWILEVLGVQKGDEVIDLYPGTGAMGQAIDRLNGCYQQIGGLW